MSYRELDPETRAERVALLLAERRELGEHMRRVRVVVWSRRAWVWMKCSLLLGGVAGGLSLLLFSLAPCLCGRCCTGSRFRDTQAGAATVASAVEMYMAENPGAQCPAMDDLLGDGYINPSTRTTDGWDHEYAIKCAGHDVYVASPGPDGVLGTSDDIGNGVR